MARRGSYKRKIRRRIRKTPIVLLLIAILAIAGALMWKGGMFEGLSFGTGEETKPENVIDIPAANDGSEVSYHIIDVGQGDAILIKTSSGNMLIDSGDLGSEPRKLLKNYLNSQNITKFEYVVFTHPDADHIGSSDFILQNYEVGTVIMPDKSHTTAVYGRLIDELEKGDMELILIGEDEDCEHYGYTFKLGGVTNTVMAPVKDIDSRNEMSVVIRSVYGETSVMLTGDAEHLSEEEMLKIYKKGELDCDILKVGHHGSRTSTTDGFLEAVSPEHVIISCGEGNKHNHPHKETIDKFTDAGLVIHRTDHDGTVVVRTDGKTYTVEDEK